MTAEEKAGKCDVGDCKRSSSIVIEIRGEWVAVCNYHAAPKHWKLKEDFDAHPTLFGTKNDKS
tara:strand:+ start:1127 stop:1315 length:189 start_codon:yes stop_codon:yes gene_type:complete